MGKALPKQCEACKKTISGANWAKHKRTHVGKEVVGKKVRGPVKLKTGRPKKAHPLDKPSIVALINERGPALLQYERNKLSYIPEGEKVVRFLQMLLRRWGKGDDMRDFSGPLRRALLRMKTWIVKNKWIYETPPKSTAVKLKKKPKVKPKKKNRWGVFSYCKFCERQYDGKHYVHECYRRKNGSWYRREYLRSEFLKTVVVDNFIDWNEIPDRQADSIEIENTKKSARASRARIQKMDKQNDSYIQTMRKRGFSNREIGEHILRRQTQGIKIPDGAMDISWYFRPEPEPQEGLFKWLKDGTKV